MSPFEILNFQRRLQPTGRPLMNDSNVLQALGQVSSESASEVFRTHLRGVVRQMITDAMVEEVTELCGPKHHPADSDYFRAGSSPGRVIYEGKRESVVRPRIRRRKADGSTTEVQLATYEAASSTEQLRESIVSALVAGASTRDVAKTQDPSTPGSSKSNVSRHWQAVGHKFVDQLRGQDLSKTDWAVLMLDGIFLSKDQTAIVAVGITADGYKHILDFELGSTENAEVCRDLMRRLVSREFHCDRPLFSVLDGSQALKTALLEFFSDAVIQRCLVHKERNIRAKLSKRHWGELARLFTRLRKVQGKKDAEDVVKELVAFLKPINAEALNSLEEAGEDLIALQSLGVPNTLHRNLLSTNAIENSFRNTRRKLGRVTRFRAETDQATRWLAYALTEVEKGFRRISGYRDLDKLISALEKRKKVSPKKLPAGIRVGESNEKGDL